MAELFPRLDILPSAQQRLWPKLKPAAALGFALYGGTAVALRLGHRASIDFGFFSDAPLDRNALFAAMPLLEESRVLQDRPDTLTFLVVPDGQSNDAVKISFFAAITFGRVGVPQWTSDRVAQVASPEDLLGTKLKVLLQRIEAKDYVDVAAILGGGASHAVGLGAARALFGQAFQPSECLKALVYFEGGDLESLPRHVKNTLIASAAAVGDIPHVPLAHHRLALP